MELHSQDLALDEDGDETGFPVKSFEILKNSFQPPQNNKQRHLRVPVCVPLRFAHE